MKNKLRQLIARLEQVRFFGAIAKGVRTCWTRLFHHFGLKLLSLLIAILLWNFVITTNSSITRTKTITDLTGYISGQSVLSASYGLALLDDPAEMLSDISVLVEVSQSEFARVSSDNVQVTLDLSSVRRAGTQEVALKAATSYGRVVQIMPDSLTLTFETLDSRVIPVNVQMVGAAEGDRWYNVNRSNPSALTIKGAASVVQSIVSAYVYIDVTSARTPFTVAERYVLLDSEGNEIPQTMLDRSSSSISVSMDVYPTKEIPISTELANVVTGQPAEGYVVERVDPAEHADRGGRAGAAGQHHRAAHRPDFRGRPVPELRRPGEGIDAVVVQVDLCGGGLCERRHCGGDGQRVGGRRGRYLCQQGRGPLHPRGGFEDPRVHYRPEERYRASAGGRLYGHGGSQRIA